MFSLRNLRFVLCSRDLDVLRAQRIIGFFYLNYPQSNEVRISDHMIKAFSCTKGYLFPPFPPLPPFVLRHYAGYLFQ